ncbi:hypothetical protein [Flavobacterium sp.]|uniref:hypothetical protein n=1 Tax=Flavobacterium sp. TaxID=239 RepID=UPI003A8EAE05
MNELKSLLEILSKISVKDFGQHLTNIVDLYKKPISSYKKVISYRKKSYDYFLLFVIYYSIVVYFMIEDTKFVIPLTFLELLLTLIPFSVLIFPFLFFRKLWNKKIKSNRLFRLLFIIKIQFNLILLIIVLIARWAMIDSLYVILHNYLMLIFIAIILIPPMILQISLIKKIIWIITNYIFSLLYFIIALFLMNLPDVEKLALKANLDSPVLEYLKFRLDYEDSDILSQAQYYTVIFQLKNNTCLTVRNTQFSTYELAIDLREIHLIDLKNKLKLVNDSLDKDSNIDYKRTIVPVSTMDSIREVFNDKFYHDLKITNSLSKITNFSSNRELYKIKNEFLRYYDSIYTSRAYVDKVIKGEVEFSVLSDENHYIVIYKINEPYLIKLQEQIAVKHKYLLRREEYSFLLMTIYTYPLDLILTVCGYYD